MKTRDKIILVLMVIGFLDLLLLWDTDIGGIGHDSWRLFYLFAAAGIMKFVYHFRKWAFITGLTVALSFAWIANDGLDKSDLVMVGACFCGIVWLARSGWQLLKDLINEDKPPRVRWVPTGNCEYCGEAVTAEDWGEGKAIADAFPIWTTDLDDVEHGNRLRIAHTVCREAKVTYYSRQGG